MKKHWICYALAWTGCVVFFLCYQMWFAWLTLVAVTVLPVLSLLLSLPVMLSARLQLVLPAAVDRGTPVSAKLVVSSTLPLPQWSAKLAVGRELTGQRWMLTPGQDLPTEHCGFLDCRVFNPRIYDYLGLFYRKLPVPQSTGVSVRPVAEKAAGLPGRRPSQVLRWRAKRGGGYSENHELRLYQPGDNLRHIHWKLSSKTGKLLLREPLEPDMPPILGICLNGSFQELDDKLGWLLWTAQELLDKSIVFRLLALTGDGQLEFSVGDESSLLLALDQILAQRPCPEGAQLTAYQPIHRIGGGT